MARKVGKEAIETAKAVLEDFKKIANTERLKRIRKVAEVARLNLSEKEIDKFSKDLFNILVHFKILQKAGTKNVEPSFQPLPMQNILREDRAGKGIPQKEALANARLKEKGYFKGPKVV